MEGGELVVVGLMTRKPGLPLAHPGAGGGDAAAALVEGVAATGDRSVGGTVTRLQLAAFTHLERVPR